MWSQQQGGGCEADVLKETKLYFSKASLSFASFAIEFGFVSFPEHKNSNNDNKSYSELSSFPHKALAQPVATLSSSLLELSASPMNAALPRAALATSSADFPSQQLYFQTSLPATGLRRGLPLAQGWKRASRGAQSCCAVPFNPGLLRPQHIHHLAQPVVLVS